MRGGKDHDREQRDQPRRAGSRGLDRGLRRRLESRGLDALSGRSREMREAMGEHRSAQGLAHAARGMLAQEGSRVIDGLPSIQVPTLIIVGDQDKPFLVPCEYMAKKYPARGSR